MKKEMVADLPAAITAFRTQAEIYLDAGAFAQEDGSTEAKAWFLSHISPDFVCDRDFGGTCVRGSFLDRVNSFLMKSGRGSLYGEGAKPHDPDSLLSRGLHTVAIDLSALLGPFAVRESEAGEYCRAGLVPRSWETLQQAVQTVMANPANSIDDELTAIDRLKGVLGAWNIRARPDAASEIVGRAHNEVVLFLKQKAQQGAKGHRWHAVRLHSGIDGFLAATDTDLVHQISPRSCLRLNAIGQVEISRYIGGGD